MDDMIQSYLNRVRESDEKVARKHRTHAGTGLSANDIPVPDAKPDADDDAKPDADTDADTGAE